MASSQIQDHILKTIGHTPIVRLNKVNQTCPHEILVKCEFMNPGGSVKDRIGHWIIEDAEKKGLLKPGGTIVEATSGNTGMGLAIAAAVKGYKTVFVLPDKMSQEKIKTLRAFGARVVITPTAVGPDDPRSHYSVSKRLSEEIPNAFLANQYHNLANREAHYHSTGPEIWEQTQGSVDLVFAGMGTGGTITGIAHFLKEKNPRVRIVGVDPIGSILFDYFKRGVTIEAQSYKVEGIGEDIFPKNLDFSLLDDMVQINDQESFSMTRRLLLEEGLFVGASAGAAVAGAIKYLQKYNLKNQKAVVILPDSGNRYLSKVFDDDWMRENGFLNLQDWGTLDEYIHKVTPPQPICVQDVDTLQKAIQIMRDKGVSQLPVINAQGKITGILQENHVLQALVEGLVQLQSSAKSIAKEQFRLFQLKDSVSDASKALTSGLTPIIESKGTPLAVVTKIDLITYLEGRNP